MRQLRSLIVLSSVGASLLVAAAAEAQTTTTTTGATVMPTSQTAPVRLINGNVVAPRSQNLTPLGVNYSDCINNMVLQFSVSLQNFTGSQELQVWATTTGTCSDPAARGVAGQIPSCWNLGPCGQAFTVQNQSVQCDVRVQDLVGAENEPPNPATQVSFGPEACNAQASFAPVALNVWFVPVDSLGNLSGTAYSYAIPSDLVGPPPPAVGTPGIGDTLLLLNWTANTDSDTAGYDIFMDPPPGTNPTFIPTLFCPDGSAASSTSSATTSASTSSTSSSSLDDGSADDGAIDDASDTGVSATTSSSATSSTTASSSAAATSAACYYVGGNSSVGGSGCNSTVLAESASTLDSGSETVVDVTDEAGDIIDSSVTFGIGGHSNLLCDYLVGTGCTKGQPAYTAQNTSVAGESGTHFNITQLQNSFLYNIAVAAVDNSGNVGPQSPVVCQTPLPVDDFFKVYRQSGGGAGGNFCSLDAVGDPAASSIASAGALGVGALAFGRRRRRRKGR